MVLAEEYQVVEVGRSAVCPVLDVVGVKPSGAIAARETASAVPPSQLGEEPGRDDPGRAAYTDDAVVVVDTEADAGIAAQSS